MRSRLQQHQRIVQRTVTHNFASSSSSSSLVSPTSGITFTIRRMFQQQRQRRGNNNNNNGHRNENDIITTMMRREFTKRTTNNASMKMDNSILAPRRRTIYTTTTKQQKQQHINKYHKRMFQTDTTTMVVNMNDNGRRFIIRCSLFASAAATGLGIHAYINNYNSNSLRCESSSTAASEALLLSQAKGQQKKREENVGDELNKNFKESVMTGLRSIQLAILFSPALFFAPVTYLKSCPLWYKKLWYALIRKTLEFSGPAFIKWGQWASTRYDVFPAVLCHELEKLQSTAPEHKWEHTKSTLERVYGDTFDHIFESFDERPMASGSIAQVHRATLREGVAESSKRQQDLFSRFNYALIAGVEMLLSGQGFNSIVDGIRDMWNDGAAGIGHFLHMDETIGEDDDDDNEEDLQYNAQKGKKVVVVKRQKRREKRREVAVKVRHPGVVDKLKRDFKILLWFASFTKNISWLEPLQLENTVGQFGVHMLSQVDLGVEAENLNRFRKSFLLMPAVSFPTPITSLSAEDVLVETFESGTTISSYLVTPEVAEKVGFECSEQNRTLAALGVQTLLKMLIDDNFLHADLHPGNILVRLPGKDMKFNSSDKSDFINHGPTLEKNGERQMKNAPKPEIIILDTGLAATLTRENQSDLAEMFSAMLKWDGRGVAERILKFVSPTSKPHIETERFKSEMEETLKQFAAGPPRAGDCMSKVFEIVQEHRLCLDPSIMIAVVTVMVLEGWQWRLDPSVSILDRLNNVLESSKKRYHRMKVLDWSLREMYDPYSGPNFYEKDKDGVKRRCENYDYGMSLYS
jgi:aarF domain-containing kinase